VDSTYVSTLSPTLASWSIFYHQRRQEAAGSPFHAGTPPLPHLRQVKQLY